MNKGITLIISLVVLAAMGLVMFSHIGGKKTPGQPSPFMADQGSEQRQGGFATPLHAPQGSTGGIRPIGPPISSAGFPPADQPPQPDGAPQPVRLTPSFDGNLPQPVASPQDPGAQTPAGEALSAAMAALEVAQPQAPAAAERPDLPPPSNVASGAGTGSPGLTPWESPPQEAPAAQAPAPATPVPTPAPQPSPSAITVAPAAPSPGAHTLRDISLTPSGQGMILQIEADSPFPANAFVLTGPDCLVVDLPGSWSGIRIPSIPANRMIQNVRLGQQSAGPRLVLDLAVPIQGHSIERSGNTVRIIMR